MQPLANISGLISIDSDSPPRWPMDIKYVTKRRLFVGGPDPDVPLAINFRLMSSSDRCVVFAQSRRRVQRENFLEYLERINEAKR